MAHDPALGDGRLRRVAADRTSAPAVITKATDEYFTGQDRFTQWLEDECDAEPGNKFKHAPIADLYASWSTYCRDNGDEPGSKNALAEEVESHGFERTKVGHAKTRSYSGIRLLRPAPRS